MDDRVTLLQRIWKVQISNLNSATSLIKMFHDLSQSLQEDYLYI